MSSKIVLLTTDTPHHLYFAWKLQEKYAIEGILLETVSLKPAFDTFHPIEKLRDDYERQTLLSGGPKHFKDLTHTIQAKSSNDDSSFSQIQKWNPHIILVFGTGHLKTATRNSSKATFLNLHGGDPEHYRGLDSHYWTIYHKDFDHLTTTLHLMEETLDGGAVVAQEKLVLKKNMQPFQLRGLNTLACVKITLCALDQQRETGQWSLRPQTQKGRYYSFMPTALKEVCLQHFRKHVECL